jgi:hypothetical protein
MVLFGVTSDISDCTRRIEYWREVGVGQWSAGDLETVAIGHVA